MKSVIILAFALVISALCVAQTVDTSKLEAFMPKGERSPKQIKAFLKSGSQRATKMSDYLLTKTGEENIDTLFEKVDVEKISFENAEYLNSGWNPEKKEIQFYRGRKWKGHVLVYKNEYQKLVLCKKDDCANLLDVLETKLSDEDLPYLPDSVSSPKEVDVAESNPIVKDVFVDTAQQTVYYVYVNNPIGRVYYGNGIDYIYLTDYYGFYQPAVWYGWSWYWHSSCYSFERRHRCHVNNYIEYNNYNVVCNDDGGRVTPPGHGYSNDGGRVTPPGNGLNGRSIDPNTGGGRVTNGGGTKMPASTRNEIRGVNNIQRTPAKINQVAKRTFERQQPQQLRERNNSHSARTFSQPRTSVNLKTRSSKISYERTPPTNYRNNSPIGRSTGNYSTGKNVSSRSYSTPTRTANRGASRR